MDDTSTVLVRQATARPTRKTSATGIAGSMTTVFAWVLVRWVGIEVPADVAVALTAIIGFVFSYMTHDREVPGLEPIPIEEEAR